jgi:hypothetical protein
LYVEKGGIYYEIPDVDQWPEDRDARGYNGPFPVVAHPPYQRWSSLAKLCESKYGIKAEQDGGCFEHALNCVRKFGGVLEHPSRSLAFKKYLLPTPTKFGVWEYWPDDNSWTIQFNQSTYGHKSQKPTWLYYVGNVPPLPIDSTFVAHTHQIGGAGRLKNKLPTLDKGERSRTPYTLAKLLVRIAEMSVSEAGRVNKAIGNADGDSTCAPSSSETRTGPALMSTMPRSDL